MLQNGLLFKQTNKGPFLQDTKYNVITVTTQTVQGCDYSLFVNNPLDKIKLG